MVHLCTNLGRVLILRVKYIKEDIKRYIVCVYIAVDVYVLL